MEQGTGHQYRGKSLDEIDINVNHLVSDEEPDSDEDCNENYEDPQGNQNRPTNNSKLNKILKLPNDKNKELNVRHELLHLNNQLYEKNTECTKEKSCHHTMDQRRKTHCKNVFQKTYHYEDGSKKTRM